MKRTHLSKLAVSFVGMSLALSAHAADKTTAKTATPAAKATTATTGKTDPHATTATTGKTDPHAAATTATTGKTDPHAAATTATAATTKLTKDQITAIQNALAKHGEKVKTDGNMDATTKTALQNFQGKNGLPKTGEPDAATLSKLGVKL